MILTASTKKVATDLVEKKLEAAARNRILYSAVKLFATGYTPPGQRKLGDFNGSGVIVNVETRNNKKVVTILSAMHNVMSWSQTKAIPNNDLIGKFAAATTIKWVKSDAAFNSEPKGETNKAPVPGTQITDQCGQRNLCFYDLLVLECEDEALYDFAYENVFAKAEDTIGGEANAICGQSGVAESRLLKRAQYDYLQLGYGKITEARTKQKIDKDTKKLVAPTIPDDTYVATAAQAAGMEEYHLHYRLTSLKSEQFASAFDQTTALPKPNNQAAPTYQEYVHALLHTGKTTNTSAPGDSGGPMYAINKDDPSKLFLLGITSGADMQLAKKPAYVAFKNCVSTSVGPYMRTKRPQ